MTGVRSLVAAAAPEALVELDRSFYAPGMVESELIQLSRELIRLTDGIAGVREKMKKLLLNGAGDPPDRPIVRRAHKPGKLMAAREADRRTLALIQEQPGLNNAAIARAMGEPATSARNRLTRLQRQGLIARASDGAWSAGPTSA